MAKLGLIISSLVVLLFAFDAFLAVLAVEAEAPMLLHRVKRHGPWRWEDRGRWESERSRLRELIAVESDAVRLAELQHELQLLEEHGGYYGWGR